MAFLRLKFNPGVNRDTTNYSGEGSWWDGNKVRFISGQVQKIGGWLKTSTNTFFGVCRQMCAWNTTFSDIFIALGTNNKLYIEVSGAYHDITPLRATDPTMSSTDTDNCIVTTNGSTTVTVNLGAAYAANDQSFVTIAGVTGDVGGIPNAEINANHLITEVDSDTFTFVVASAASSGATGGGTSITIKFEIAPGYASDTIGYGWSTGT